MKPTGSRSDPEPLDALVARLANQPIGFSGKLRRAAQILQHYQFSQIARRLIRVGQRRLQPYKCVGDWPHSVVRMKRSAAVSKLAKVIVDKAREHPSHSLCDLSKGKYVLLNHEVNADGLLPSETLLQSQTHLWRFQFHYHEFLLNAASRGCWEQVAKILHQWLLAYAPCTTKRSDDSWHPYCISRRVMIWIWLLVQSRDLGGKLGEELTQKLLQSLEHQSQFLSLNLEWELGGNHLIENATALAIASSILESAHANSWLRIAGKVLSKEVPRQVLPHGEHFELSPMYHCQILANLLRIEICCENSDETSEGLRSKIQSMFQFLECILHPDGEIPLFADSVFYESPSVEQIRTFAGIASIDAGAKINAERPGNYFIIDSGDTYAICDFGDIAAPHLPAHGHCDALNLEVSIAGNRWIVDSGNFNYSNDSMRQYCRSSIAHNVVTIDDDNQANIWSMFRMGRRPRVVNFRSFNRLNWKAVSAAHDGYAATGVNNLTRLIAVNEEVFICFDFNVSATKPSGKDFVGYLHLHPELDVGDLELVGNRRYRIQLRRLNVIRWLTFEADSVTTEQGWYCQEFGKREAGTVVRYVTSVSNGCTGWVMQESSNTFEIEFRDRLFGFTMEGRDTLRWEAS